MAPISLIPDVLLFTAGRACAGPLAVVLHSYSSGLEVLDLEMQRCPRPRPAQSPGCHTSFHYGIGVGGFHQYVLAANTAWGFGLTVPTCPEPICPPNPCESCTGLTADQYNTDVDGVPPTLPAWAVGPDGTVNCAVLHVAITGQGSGSDPDCCRFFDNERAYTQLVNALCQVFTAAGLVPSLDTLLVHCEELICLDIETLIEDIIAFDCTPPTVNPCNACPPEVDDTPSINFTLAGPVVSADVVISPNVGNTLTELPNGLFVADATIADAPVCAAQAELPLVFGSDAAGGPGTWGKPQRGPLLYNAQASGGNIDPSLGFDVIAITGAGGSTTLAAPATCEKSDLWVKNISANPQDITTASLIDGQVTITLAGTSVGAFPFGANGGDAVHLVWNGGTWLII